MKADMTRAQMPDCIRFQKNAHPIILDYQAAISATFPHVSIAFFEPATAVLPEVF